MVHQGASDASRDATVILPAVGAAEPPAPSTWGGPGGGAPQPDDSYAGYFRAAPGEPSPAAPAEPNPDAMTQVIPAVRAQPAPGQPYDHRTGAGQQYPQQYPQPYQGGPHQDDEYYDGQPHRRGNAGVMIAVGVAVVALAVVVASITTLGDHGKAPVAQAPDPTQVVMPADTPTPTEADTSASAQAPVPTTDPASSTSSSQSAAPQAGRIIGVGSSRCVDIPGANASNGNQLDLFDCNGTGAQAWTYVNGTVQALGKCLDVRGASTDDRTPVQVFDCNGTAAQQWTYDPQTGELKTLGKCLDASGGGTGNGTPLILYTCKNSSNQQWRVAPAA
jgi:hypothetical protein